jgi:hypothetical protein
MGGGLRLGGRQVARALARGANHVEVRDRDHMPPAEFRGGDESTRCEALQVMGLATVTDPRRGDTGCQVS